MSLATPVSLPLAARVNAAFEARVRAVLGTPDRQASILREHAALNAVLSRGGEISDEQAADYAVMLAINEWEAAAIAVRRAAIRHGIEPEAIDWPPMPASVTMDWLDEF